MRNEVSRTRRANRASEDGMSLPSTGTASVEGVQSIQHRAASWVLSAEGGIEKTRGAAKKTGGKKTVQARKMGLVPVFVQSQIQDQDRAVAAWGPGVMV